VGNCVNAFPWRQHVQDDAIHTGYRQRSNFFLQIPQSDLPISWLGTEKIRDILLGNFGEIFTTLEAIKVAVSSDCAQQRARKSSGTNPRLDYNAPRVNVS
jgi:hypothetical protein